jgi:hypothetical protein
MKRIFVLRVFSTTKMMPRTTKMIATTVSALIRRSPSGGRRMRVV